MSAPPEITRRSLLAAGAAGVAGVAGGRFVRPADAVAALSEPAGPVGVAEPVCFERWVGDITDSGDDRRCGPECGPRRALNGRRASDASGLELRVQRPDGSFSPWVSAGGHGHGPDLSPASARLTGDPVWTGGGRSVQLRAGRALSGVRLKLVDVSFGRDCAWTGACGGDTRFGGGARARSPRRSRRGRGSRRSSPGAPGPAGVAPPAGGAGIWGRGDGLRPSHREPQRLHLRRGAGDAARDLRLPPLRQRLERHRLQLRARPVRAHLRGPRGRYRQSPWWGRRPAATTSSQPASPCWAASRKCRSRLPRKSRSSACWPGSFRCTASPPPGRVTVRVNPAGARYSRFPAGAHVSLPRIAGHRDGDSTDCPGNVLYGELPRIRRGRQPAGRAPGAGHAQRGRRRERPGGGAGRHARVP